VKTLEVSLISLVSPEIEQYAVDHTTPLPDYLEELTRVTYEEMASPGMLTGPVEGTLLQFLVWATNARRVLEIGTFTGFSAQMMAAALPDDGVLVTCDIDPKAAKMARQYFARSPHGRKIELRLGEALETLKSLNGPFDLVFIDADKESYVAYYDRAMELLSPNGIIAVDNVLWSGRVLDPKSESDHAIVEFNRHVRQDPRVRHVLLPVRDGVMLVRRA
jgi:caffeoyl-CoA O-methyltransferase